MELSESLSWEDMKVLKVGHLLAGIFKLKHTVVIIPWFVLFELVFVTRLGVTLTPLMGYLRCLASR